MIQIDHLDFGYPGSKHQVFGDFSLTLHESNIYGLLGKNGTGKSTLLYLLCGLLRAKRGTILVDGKAAGKRQPDMLRDIFLIPEEFELPNVKLSTYVDINRGFYPFFSQQVLDSCLRDFELPISLRLGELSMGQKKKVYMCIALAARTKLLIMDEPTNGLDIPSKSQFRKVIAQGTREDQTIIISTHQVRDVEMMLDHVTIIDGNRVLMNAPINMEEPVNLEELFIQAITRAEMER